MKRTNYAAAIGLGLSLVLARAIPGQAVNIDALVFYSGDFTGEGNQNVAAHDPDTGEWYVNVQDSSPQNFKLWVTGFGNRGLALEEALVGDFNGDGIDDIAIHNKQTGEWWRAPSTGRDFTIQRQRWFVGFGNRPLEKEESFVMNYDNRGPKQEIVILNRANGGCWFGDDGVIARCAPGSCAGRIDSCLRRRSASAQNFCLETILSRTPGPLEGVSRDCEYQIRRRTRAWDGAGAGGN